MILELSINYQGLGLPNGEIDLSKLIAILPGAKLVIDNGDYRLVWDDGLPDVEDTEPPKWTSDHHIYCRLESLLTYDVKTEEQRKALEAAAQVMKPGFDAHEAAIAAWAALPNKTSRLQAMRDRIEAGLTHHADQASSLKGEAPPEEAKTVES